MELLLGYAKGLTFAVDIFVPARGVRKHKNFTDYRYEKLCALSYFLSRKIARF